jgi:hypothetical protein
MNYEIIYRYSQTKNEIINNLRHMGYAVYDTHEMIDKGFTRYFLEKHADEIKVKCNYSCYDRNLYIYEKALEIKVKKIMNKLNKLK